MSVPIAGARLASSDAAPSSGVPLLDSEALLSACGGSEAFLKRICELLSKMLPVELDRATLALREGTVSGLRHIAHQLSGMLAAFSTVAATVASELEEAAARQDLATAGALLDQLRPMADEIVRLVSTVSVQALMRADAQS
jgi:HPt (histidine-containing phosphotransfer) domain-containing protein